MDDRKSLILELKQVPIMERGDWKFIHPKYDVGRTTRAAAQVGGRWIPKSQLRGDSDDGSLYVSMWWWKKENLGRKLKVGA